MRWFPRLRIRFHVSTIYSTDVANGGIEDNARMSHQNTCILLLTSYFHPVSGTLSLCHPVSAIEMATPQPFFVFLFSILFISVAATTKDQTSCTMCSECGNPCLPPSLPPPSPPPPLPPPPPPPPVSDCPPPPEPVPNCPPPPPDGLQLPPPHPPIEGCDEGGCVGGGGGGWYPPRLSAPDPILPYFPYIYYAPPLSPYLSNSAHFRNHPIVSSIFLGLSFFYLV